MRDDVSIVPYRRFAAFVINNKQSPRRYAKPLCFGAFRTVFPRTPRQQPYPSQRQDTLPKANPGNTKIKPKGVPHDSGCHHPRT